MSIILPSLYSLQKRLGKNLKGKKRNNKQLIINKLKKSTLLFICFFTHEIELQIL